MQPASKPTERFTFGGLGGGSSKATLDTMLRLTCILVVYKHNEHTLLQDIDTLYCFQFQFVLLVDDTILHAS